MELHATDCKSLDSESVIILNDWSVQSSDLNII